MTANHLLKRLRDNQTRCERTARQSTRHNTRERNRGRADAYRTAAELVQLMLWDRDGE